jgi:hypothetical protein
LRYESIQKLYFEKEPRKFVELVRFFIQETDEIGQDSVGLRELFFADVERLSLRTDPYFMSGGLSAPDLTYHTLQSLIDMLIVQKNKLKLEARL